MFIYYIWIIIYYICIYICVFVCIYIYSDMHNVMSVHIFFNNTHHSQKHEKWLTTSSSHSRFFIFFSEIKILFNCPIYMSALICFWSCFSQECQTETGQFQTCNPLVHLHPRPTWAGMQPIKRALLKGQNSIVIFILLQYNKHVCIIILQNHMNSLCQ